ncbi:MAG: PepSY domain-containing protein [Armatimonadetes bacterium]|nr:PepSY domain-containing protein [Armatimonadota bacterium]
MALHLWLGLAAGLYGCAIGLTGSLLVFREELEMLQYPDTTRAVSLASGRKPLPLSRLLAGLRQSLPDLQEKDLASLEMPARPGGVYRLYMGDFYQAGNYRLVALDPVTGQILADRVVVRTPLGFVWLLHIHLLMGAKGLLTNGIGGLVVAGMLLSGFCLWWPATVSMLKTRLSVRCRYGLKRLLYDLHNVLGSYLFLLLLPLALTGAMFAFYTPVQQAVYALTGTPPDPKPPAVTPPAEARRLPIEALVRIAERTVPEARLRGVSYPTAPSEPFIGWKQTPGERGFLPYTSVTVDPYTGHVLRVEQDRTAPAGPRVMRALSSLHFGRWGGLGTKLLYSLTGLMPTGLFLTGLLRYLQRRRGQARSRSRISRSREIPELAPSKHR